MHYYIMYYFLLLLHLLALTSLAGLKATSYGEVSLKAKQIIDESLMPPFNDRLEALKSG